MLCDKIKKREEKIAVVGLGYVGLPIAIEFSKSVDVIGFDINIEKINCYKNGFDPTAQISDIIMSKSTVEWTFDEKKLSEAKFIIIAVPTPIHSDKTPDLSLLINATRIVGKNMAKDSIVVFESTVYPGVTENICVPNLSSESNLQYGFDFKVGYSPERINPGDKEHTLSNIIKIVSGTDAEAVDEIASVYSIIAKAGVYRAPSIKVVEAAKVIENSQRDINIAFMNELSIIFNKLGIDTLEVIKAAETKWNFSKYNPGLVGGHCIGVDPYYLTYCAEQIGYHSQVILSGRKINDEMGKYVAEQTVKKISFLGKSIKDIRVGCLGITFKENCGDIRNSKVVDIIYELDEYGINPLVYDPIANKDEVEKMYSIEMVPFDALCNLNCLIIAVAHKEFQHLSNDEILRMFNIKDKGILIDVKGIKKDSLMENIIYWSL